MTARTAQQEAEARLGALGRTVHNLGSDDLGAISLGDVDEERRREVLATATDAAERAGRAALLADARRWASQLALAEVGARTYRPTWAGLQWGVTLGPATDRARLAIALEDAATAAVVEDLVDEEVVESLRAGFERIVSMRRPSAPESFGIVWSASPRVRGLALVLVAFVVLPEAIGLGSTAGPLGAVIAAAIVVVALLGALSRWSWRRRTL